ncbi:glycosyltransferase family 4 protein [Arthrobacter terrae]|uniref:glycosyltransferase family 4 protein n=1 Tax=Arthrobacter terrae TaxID=2935737 RepID=UPI001E649588|nr:glycosyltransferase family 4 protein [Arthrobacter terrae]
MSQQFRNISLAARTVAEHLTDDPILLCLQILRRLPARLVRRPALLICRLARTNSTSATVLLACIAAGDTAGLQRRFAAAVARGLSGQQARRAADVALVANLPQWADQLLANVLPGTSRLAATEARRRWYGGAMSQAVAVLGGETGALARQHARLAAELAVFSGAAAPKLRSPKRSAAGAAVSNASAPIPSEKRVLHLLTNSLPHTNSGYAQRTHSILVAQQAAGWGVRAVTRLGYPVQVGKILAKGTDVVDGVPYQRMLPGRLAAGMDSRLQQQTEELLRVARGFRPDVLHTTTHFVNGLVVREVAKALDIPWVYEVRGQLADTWAARRGPEAKDSERYRLFQEREAEVMQSADLVVTLGETMKEAIVAAGVSADKIILAPNAVGGDFLKEPMNPQAARRALGLPVDAQYIGTVSSLVDYEGLDDLVSAFALLAPEHPDLRLLIVGDGAEFAALQTQVRGLGLTERAIFTGRVPRDQTVLYHQALDIFVVPRKDLDVTRAVTPLKPVEALASARPVVASNLPALREIVNDGVNGTLVPSETPAALAAAIRRLLEDEALRRDFGVRGRTAMLRTRTWAADAATYGRAYQQLRKVS